MIGITRMIGETETKMMEYMDLKYLVWNRVREGMAELFKCTGVNTVYLDSGDGLRYAPATGEVYYVAEKCSSVFHTKDMGILELMALDTAFKKEYSRYMAMVASLELGLDSTDSGLDSLTDPED